MGRARESGVCDRCRAFWGGRRRLCLSCRQALRPLGQWYEVQNQENWLRYYRKHGTPAQVKKQQALVDQLKEKA